MVEPMTPEQRRVYDAIMRHVRAQLPPRLARMGITGTPSYDVADVVAEAVSSGVRATVDGDGAS